MKKILFLITMLSFVFAQLNEYDGWSNGNFNVLNGDMIVVDKASLASESLDEVDFATHAKWDVTNDFDDSGGNAAFVWTANQTSTLTQTQANLVIAGIRDRWYAFTYTLAVTTAFDGDAAATITTAFALTAVSLEIATAGTYTIYFKSAVTPTDFVISLVSGTDTEGTISYDDLTLKEVNGGDIYSGGALYGDIKLKELGTATYDDLQGWMNNTQSSGITSGGGFTDIPGTGTVTVAAGTGFIRATNSDIAEVLMFDWAAETPLSLTDASTNYIYVQYHATTPTIHATITKSDADNRTKILLGKIFRDGTDLHLVPAGMVTSELAKRVLTYLNSVNGEIVRGSGLGVAETGTLNILMSAGTGFAGLTPVTWTEVNTSGVPTFVYWYNDHTGWVSADISAIDNTNYNNYGANPGLVALTNNQYGVHWVYLDYDGDVHVVYGLDSYTLAGTQDADAPANLPDIVADFCLLIARITIEKAEVTTFTDVDSPWEAVITSSTVTEHSSLGGLTVDDHTQYILVTGARAFSGEALFDNNAAAATFGAVGTDADVVLAFDAVTNQGSVTYMEDEDRFDFDNDVKVGGNLIVTNSMGSDLDMGDYEILLDSTPDADHTSSGIKLELTAGEVINVGDLCYQNADGEIYLADATDATKMPGIFMCIETAADGVASDFLMTGVIRDDTWTWTVGGDIYVTITGTTGNTLSQTAPAVAGEQVQKVGVATHADRIIFIPVLTLITI